MINYTLKVIDIRQETADTITLCFKQSGLKKIKYLAGQYLTLIFRINGRRYCRPYSFSSAPGIDPFLEVTVKRIIGGIVSNHIHDQVKVDDLIEVMPPLGDFVYDPDQQIANHVVLWGVGSGITPLMSIAKFVLAMPDGPAVSLIYGNRSFESCIFLDKISQLHKQHNSKFLIRHFHTRFKIKAENPNVVEGRIDKGKAFSIIEKIAQPENTVHYICGPVGLKESVKSALLEAGTNPNRVFTEDFEIVKNPADFEGIITREIQLLKDGQHKTVEVASGKSVLEAGLDANVELSYSCQTGSCLLCKGRLLQGNLKMIGVEKGAHQLNENEYLLCCSYPLTDDVNIEV